MPVTKKIQSLNPASLPPGSTFPFRDWLVGLNDTTGQVIDVANGAETVADQALQLAEEQKERNDDQDLMLIQHEQDITSNTNRIAVVEGDIVTINSNITALDGRTTDLESRATDLETRATDLEDAVDALTLRVESLEDWRVYMTRQKSEVVYSGLTLPIPVTETNLLTLLSTLTPTSGTLAPFFDVVNGRLVALNKNRDLKLKISLRGSYPGGTTNRSMALTFGTVVPDTIVVSRNAATTVDDVFFSTFFSVEEGDDITAPGVTMTVQSFGAAFTATQIKLVATQ